MSSNPWYTLPISPSAHDTVTASPRFSNWVALPQPTTAGIPSSRATIAAWQVRPPRLVTMAEARFITGSQFGSVMSVTSTSPGCTSAMWLASATRHTLPLPMRWPIARPVARTADCCLSLKRRNMSCVPCACTVSGRACRIYSLPSVPSLPHSMSIARP